MITLKTLPQATAQEVFDQVVNHLRKQNAKSLDENEDCKYRGDNGLVCAAGCLIADEEYRSVMDDLIDSSWRGLIQRKYVPETHASLIYELQSIHDESPISTWEQCFEQVAHDYALIYKR